MVLGPLDRRALRTRCQACARRKIKCEGSPSCIYCNKKKIECVPQTAKLGAGAVFVNHTTLPEPAPNCVAGPLMVVTIPARIPEDTSSQFIRHFFSVFIARNDFAVTTLDLDAIVSQFQTSPSLYHASIAVGALDLGKKSADRRREATLAALKSYRTSLINFQREIQGTEIRRNDAGLWTTLFLGLFELMYDVSGEGWEKHILYGTSKILQLRGPGAHLTGRGRSFFLTIRVFEICRSIIFNETSFLTQNDWQTLMSRMWEGELADEWHPKEELFDLMITCSALSHRIWNALKPDSTFPGELLDKTLLDLAEDGHAIRSALQNWHDSFQVWSNCGIHANEDPRSTIAAIYYHGISIYLSGLYDYRPQFNHINAPSLPFETIQMHVENILSRTEIALGTTNLAGILFFFPLQVSGSRAVTSMQKSSILRMLKAISGRSFVVADAFTQDLSAFWSEKEVVEVENARM